MVSSLLAVALMVHLVNYELRVGGEKCVRAVWLQAGKILANILVAGATVLFRAGAQAYRQAIISEFADTRWLHVAASRHCKVNCLLKPLILQTGQRLVLEGQRLLQVLLPASLRPR